ncbi:hypothetical protein [Streptomyces venezuelae]|uniref:hypothetical protein n=1 Tax=Streptomyces venezuelae TaxID=54571 RepID=UPI00343B4D26
MPGLVALGAALTLCAAFAPAGHRGGALTVVVRGVLALVFLLGDTAAVGDDRGQGTQ